MLVIRSRKESNRTPHAVIVMRTSFDEPGSAMASRIAEAMECLECLYDGPVDYTVVSLRATSDEAIDAAKAAIGRSMDQRPCDFIVFEELTRLSRSMKRVSKLIAKWTKKGATVVVCEEPSDVNVAA